MKNRVVKIFMATLACTTLLGTTCFATDLETPNGAGTTITAPNTMKNPIYKVVIPTSYTFAIDPFEQGGQANSAIYAEDFYVINKSNVAVCVDVNLSAAGDSGVTFAADADSVSEADTSKNLYMGVEVPSAITETKGNAAAYTTITHEGSDGTLYEDKGDDPAAPSSATAPAAAVIDVTAVKGTYTSSAKQSLSSDNTKPTKLQFALAAADYQEYVVSTTNGGGTGYEFKTVAANEKGSAVFRLYGSVNTKAAWAASDVTVTGIVTFNGMTSTNYGNAQYVTDAHGLVQEGEASTFTATKDDWGISISWTGGTGDLAAKKILKVEVGTDDLAAWEKAVSGDGGDVYLPYKGLLEYKTADLPANAKVTYETVGGAQKDATVELKWS